MTEKRFKHLKKYYDTLEDLTYVGMIGWFALSIFAIVLFENFIMWYLCNILTILHIAIILLLFDDCKLWRWIDD